MIYAVIRTDFNDEEVATGMAEKLIDFFGTPAIDSGTYGEMMRKYADEIFILVTNDPISEAAGYVLEIGDPSMEDLMEKRAFDYKSRMRGEGHTMCNAFVVFGEALVAKKYQGFIGGIGA